MRGGRWMEWRVQGRRVNAHFMHVWDETNTRTSWATRCVCNEWVWQLRQNKTNKKTTCTFTSSVEFHVLCVDLGFHVVIGVGRLTVRFHHAYAIPSFLLDVVVRLCTVIVNSDCSHNSCMLHIAKTGPLRCCPYILSLVVWHAQYDYV